jgi:hypothetical protein
MRNAFFLGVILVIPAALVIALLYSLVRFYGRCIKMSSFTGTERNPGPERQRREKKRLERQKRLDNGCEHSFDSGLGGFPPGVCPKCGIAREKPVGRCDHVWRRKEGNGDGQLLREMRQAVPSGVMLDRSV